MRIARFLRFIVDWVIPEQFADDVDKVFRSRLIILTSAVMALVWLPFIFQYGPISMAIGGLIGIFTLSVPPFLKFTKSLRIAGQALVLVAAIVGFYRAYWFGGYESSVLWSFLVCPVMAVLLVGNLSGFFWLAVNAGAIFFIGYLENNGIQFPGSSAISNENIAINTATLVFVLTVIALYLEQNKNIAMKTRENEATRSASLAEDMQSIGTEIKENSKTIYSTSNELNQVMQSMKKRAQEIAQIEEESATALNQSTNTIQELANTLDETAKKMRELENKAAHIVAKGPAGATAVKESARAMRQINENRQEYDTILQAITDIADSAHLLSLNAAIEAAKAGEFGKGFFVVVEQIRDLAERSNDAVIEIRKVMKQGSFVIIRGRNVISSLFEIFNAVAGLVVKLSDQIKQILTSIEEQNIGIKEIARGTDEIASSSEENMNLIQSLNLSIQDNANTIQNLNEIAQQLEKQIVRIGAETEA